MNKIVNWPKGKLAHEGSEVKQKKTKQMFDHTGNSYFYRICWRSGLQVCLYE